MIVPLLCYNLIMLPSLDYVQVWDGLLYWKCLLDATKGSFSLEQFVCYGHPPAFTMLYGLLQYFDHGNVALQNGFSFFLGNLAVLAFAGIVRMLFPKAGALERMLMTLVFAFHPVVLGNTFHFNLDIGILFFSLYLFYFLLCDKKIGVILCGVLLVLTKEIGVFFYVALITLHALIMLFRPEQGTAGFLRLLRSRFSFLVPVPLFPIFAIVRSFQHHQIFSWGIALEYIFNPYRQVFPSDFTSVQDVFLMMQDIFLLNFLWVSSLFIVAASGIFLRRWFFRLPDASRFGDSESRVFVFILSVFVLSFLVLSTCLPTHNLRYFVVLYPLALFLLFFSLHFLRMRPMMQLSVLGIVAFLNLVSVFRSIDPLSHALYGTFQIGDHRMLAMAPIHHECCGYGRDQLVYNLEFVMLSKLQDAFFRHIRVDAKTVIATDPDVWRGFNSGAVDPVTFRRTATGGILPTYVNPYALPTPLPERLLFVEYPNFDSTQALETLLVHYDIETEEAIRISGYELPFLRMHRR